MFISNIRRVVFPFNDVSLEIGQGEFLALAGSNGAGKTTLVKLINGLLQPQNGDVFVNSLSTRSVSPAEIARYVGTCFQDPIVRVCANTVREEVGFALKLKKIPKPEIDDRVNRILAQLGLDQCGGNSIPIACRPVNSSAHHCRSARKQSSNSDSRRAHLSP